MITQNYGKTATKKPNETMDKFYRKPNNQTANNFTAGMSKKAD